MFWYGEIDEVCSMCDTQSRERWRPPQNPLESSLGEKTEFTNLARTQLGHELSMIGSAAGTAVGSTGPQEGWTECFQDLQTWCPPPQDELNTPQVTTECFNFGTIGQCQVRDLDDLRPEDLMPETLGDDMAWQPLDLEEENNNTPPYAKLPQTSTSSGGKLYTSYPVSAKSPLKSTSANIMLSQSVMEEEKKPFESYNKIRDGIDNFYTEGIPFDLAEDEENFLSVPPDQVAKRQQLRVPIRTDVTVKKEKPKLKLDVNLPNPPVVMPSTPEVQNVLSEPKVGFDLIKYVVSGDYVNVGTVSGVVPTTKLYESVEYDHDYTDPGSQPKRSSPNADFVIKEEPISPEENDQPENKPLTERRAIKRRSDSNSDYIFDSDFGNSEESNDWEPSTSKGPRKPKAKKPKKSLKVKEESDVESVASSAFTDKYRELRDKNNEDSRRSRLNRKQRDMEMKRTAEKLESENRALRARADRMQKLVLDMRETIMRTIKNANKR